MNGMLDRAPARLVFLVSAAALASARSTPAQETLWTYPGAIARDSMGSSVAGIGDIDGDGVPDVAAVAPGHDEMSIPALSAGEVVVLSGATGGLLYRYTGDSRYEGILSHVGAAGDVDADGRADFFLARPNDTRNNDPTTIVGSVQVFSGRDGSRIHRITGDQSAAFGQAVAAVGDVDGDGHTDLLIGAWGAHDAAGRTTGMAVLYSGRTGSMLRRHFGLGLASSDRLGSRVTGLGDVDGDGRDDYAIAAPQHMDLPPYALGGPGYVQVFSGQSGVLLATIPGNFNGELFGSALAAVGDVDGDLVTDFVVGISEDPVFVEGTAVVFSGRTFQRIHTLHGRPGEEQRFGWFARALGDVTGDGVPDFSVGSQLLREGPSVLRASRVFCGATGRELTRFGEIGSSGSPYYVAGAMDANGDGVAELLLGDAEAGTSADSWTGAVTLVSGSEAYLTITPQRVAVADPIQVRVSGGPSGLPVALFVTEVSGVPLWQNLAVSAFDANREWNLAGMVPPVLGGLTVRLRAVAVSWSGVPILTAEQEFAVQ